MNQPGPYRLFEINAMDRDTFVRVFGIIFEDSPWAAEKAFAGIPFSSVETLFARFFQSVRDAGEQAQLALLRAHPELGAQKLMADASIREQRAAGIDQAAGTEQMQLARLNREYREKFGFPFIIAVKGLTTADILDSLKLRILNEKDDEFEECLRQVFRIATFRLDELILEDD